MKTMKIIRIALVAVFMAVIAVTLASLIYGIITGGADTNLLN